MKTVKKLPSVEQMNRIEDQVGMAFCCLDMEGLKKYKERRKAEIAQKKALQIF